MNDHFNWKCWLWVAAGNPKTELDIQVLGNTAYMMKYAGMLNDLQQRNPGSFA